MAQYTMWSEIIEIANESERCENRLLGDIGSGNSDGWREDCCIGMRFCLPAPILLKLNKTDISKRHHNNHPTIHLLSRRPHPSNKRQTPNNPPNLHPDLHLPGRVLLPRRRNRRHNTPQTRFPVSRNGSQPHNPRRPTLSLNPRSPLAKYWNPQCRPLHRSPLLP